MGVVPHALPLVILSTAAGPLHRPASQAGPTPPLRFAPRGRTNNLVLATRFGAAELGVGFESIAGRRRAKPASRDRYFS